MLWIICAGIVGITYKALRWLQRLDEEWEAEGETGKKERGNMASLGTVIPCCLCLVSSEVVFAFHQIIGYKQAPFLRQSVLPLLLLSVVAGCLSAACVMDMESCMVYDYVWWIGGLSAVLLLPVGRRENLMEWMLEPVLFILLQELFFYKMYGRADCHGFALCAIVEAAVGMKMAGFLLHMLLAFGLLGVIQGMRHNINRKGNLKQAVPFLPYIMVSFWITLFGYGCRFRLEDSVGLWLISIVKSDIFRQV